MAPRRRQNYIRYPKYSLGVGNSCADIKGASILMRPQFSSCTFVMEAPMSAPAKATFNQPQAAVQMSKCHVIRHVMLVLTVSILL